MKIQVLAKCEQCGEIYDELGPLHLCADKRPRVEDQDDKQDDEHDNNSRGDWWGKDDSQDIQKEYCEGPIQTTYEIKNASAGQYTITDTSWADFERTMRDAREKIAVKAMLQKTIPFTPSLRDLIVEAKVNAGEVVTGKFLDNYYVGGIGEQVIDGHNYTPEQWTYTKTQSKQVMLTLRREDGTDYWVAPNGARVETKILFDLGLLS